MAAQIVTVALVKRPGRWGGWRIRTTTERGAVRYQGDYEQRDHTAAHVAASRLARRHGADFEEFQ
jgi:hypothetical protein